MLEEQVQADWNAPNLDPLVHHLDSDGRTLVAGD